MAREKRKLRKRLRQQIARTEREIQDLQGRLDASQPLESNHRTRRAIHRLERELLLPLHEKHPIQSVQLLAER